MSGAFVAVGWIINAPLLIAMLWFVWWIWNSNFVLDKRLTEGDFGLLTSTSYSINEVIRAPAGSRVDVVAQIAIPQNAMRMMPMRLPDGRVMMVPVRMGGGYYSMHTSQQPPVQQTQQTQ